jgi:BirA family biotin operon repressor/biotin-[acetyl-CoA-carboxylase] ligase
MSAGLALIEAIDVAVPTAGLMLKWPNDVMLSGRKLAGILLERSGERVALGFGVNLAGAPGLSDREAASLDAAILPQAFAPLLAASFGRILDLWRKTDPALIAKAWLERAHPIGSNLTVHSSAEEQLTGRFEGLDADGALRLRRDDGSIDIIRAGDVEL